MVFWKRKSATSAAAGSEIANQAAETSPSPSDGAVFGESGAKESEAAEKKSWWQRWKNALQKTNELLRTDIRDLWKAEGELVDDAFLDKLYAILVRTDMGNAMATRIRESIHAEYRGRRIEMKQALLIIRSEISQSLQSKGAGLAKAESGPTIILVVGVNGSGKTTSIAKLAHRLTREGNRVLLGAGDTFRAAAVEQLKIWSERIGCDIVQGDHGSDPGTVVYRSIQRAVTENFDICILDTAGRLQTQNNLMQELEKIKRIISKQVPGAPHEVLLVLDATAGQNAISQAKGFSNAAGCTGIVLAKLDGSAKGGVIIPIAQQFNLPVKFVGLGEKLDDLAEFNADSFGNALFGDND